MTEIELNTLRLHLNDVGLGEWAIHTKAWQWMEAMAVYNTKTHEIARIADVEMFLQANEDDPMAWIPLVNDPATKGCIRHLACEAWNAAYLEIIATSLNTLVVFDDGGEAPLVWLCTPKNELGKSVDPEGRIVGKSEMAAIICALDLAPSKDGLRLESTDPATLTRDQLYRPVLNLEAE